MGYRTAFAGIVLSLASAAWAGSWSITTSEFREQTGDLAAATAEGIILQQDGKALALPWDQIAVMQQRDIRSAAAAEPFVLYTRQGQRMAGSPVQMTADALTWQSGLAGKVVIPIDQVKGWARSDAPLPESAGKEDLVVMTNRDELRGVVDAADGGIAVQQGTTGSSTVQWTSIKAVVLADIGSTPAAPTALARLWVRSADGSLYSADSIQVQQGQLQLMRQGTTSSLPLSAVQQIQNRSGKVTFLSWLQPSEFHYAPYLQFSEEKPTGVRTLDEVTLQERRYVNVIELRPKATLRYTAPSAGRLHLTYACAKAGDLTDMSVQVQTGTSVVREEKSYRSTVPATPIDAAVSQGDIITISVGYGTGFDAQDYLWLLDAAVVAQ